MYQSDLKAVEDILANSSRQIGEQAGSAKEKLLCERSKGSSGSDSSLDTHTDFGFEV